MFTRLSRVVVLLAAVQILGGHWAALQTAAWVGMIADFAHGTSLVQAVEKTFDGAHPCALCKVVQNGQAEEKKQQIAKVVLKVEAVLAAAVCVPAPAVSPWKFFVLCAPMTARALAPPSPPPVAA